MTDLWVAFETLFVRHHLSLLVEVCGFSLAVFDLFFHQIASRLEARLMKLRSASPGAIWEWMANEIGHANDRVEPGKMTPTVVALGLPAMAFGIWYGVRSHSVWVGLTHWLAAGLPTVPALFLAGLTLRLILPIFAPLTNNRPIAGVGVVCAGCGLFFEVLRTLAD